MKRVSFVLLFVFSLILSACSNSNNVTTLTESCYGARTETDYAKYLITIIQGSGTSAMESQGKITWLNRNDKFKLVKKSKGICLLESVDTHAEYWVSDEKIANKKLLK